ncbi:HD domain-containing protein [bacterium]|nr:HD domain-containing protein [bacterium]MBU1025944.1 HD domain-containing protein [bacterium]
MKLLYDILASMLKIGHIKNLILDDPVLRIICNQASRRSIGAYLIGGFIRDALLGKNPKDADLMFTGEGNAELIGKLICEKFGSTLVKFEKHMVVFRITVEDRQVDLADLYDKTISEDQVRRDFTINSLAVDVGSFVQIPNPDISDILDVNDGLSDLQNGIIRINSKEVIADDPLRIVRMFRFEKQLGFDIDVSSLNAIDDNIDKLADVSGERVRDELFQVLSHPKAYNTIEKMNNAGVLAEIFPDVEKMRGVTQNEYHHLDVLDHTMSAINQFETVVEFQDPITSLYRDELTGIINDGFVPNRSRASLMKLALLFHDIGKPETRAIREDGKVTFIGHDKLGLKIIKPYLDYLHLSNREVHYIISLVEGHLRPGFINLDSPALSKAIFRFFDRFNDIGVDLVLFSIADRLAAQGEMVDDAVNEQHNQISSILLDAYFNKNKLLVRPTELANGDDLMRELSLQAGKRIGILLKVIKEGQASGEVSTYDDAIEYAKNFMKDNE